MGLGVIGGRDRLPTQLDGLVGIALVAADDAKDPARPHPGRLVAVGGWKEVEDLLAPAFCCSVVAGDQSCLPETGEDGSCFRAFITRKQLCGQGELGAALLELPTEPKVTTETLVAPGCAASGRPDVERGTGQFHGTLVADSVGGEVGCLPQAFPAVDRRSALTGRVPQLERALEMT